MTLRFTAQIKGAKELIAALKAIDPKENKRVVKQSLDRSGRLIVDSIRDFLIGPRPQRLGVVTGELRDSIHYRSSPARAQVEIGAPKPPGFPWPLLHEIGSPGGRSQRRRRTRTRGYPARPFVSTGLEAAVPDLPAVWARTWEGQLP